MLVSEMLSEIRDHGFDDLTDTRLLSFLNDTMYDISSREPWPFLEATAVATVNGSTGQVTNPTDISKVLQVVNTESGAKLEPRRLDEATRAHADSLTTQGDSSEYFFIGDQLYLYPVPASGSFTIRYIRVPPALTVSPDATPILPARHHRVIVLGSLAKCSTLEDDPDLAGVFTNMYEQRISQMRADLWMRQYDRPDVIEDVDEPDWVDILS